ncbi:MAG: cupredoxin domain-containing protein [Acidimicrobiales bacterium]
MRRLAGGAIAIVLTAAAGCGGGGTERRSISAATVGAAAGFTPPAVTVDKGDTVVLTVGNKTDKTHGFTIDGYGVREEVEALGSKKVELTASKAGTFRIRCQLHPAHQTATLVVQ